MNKHYYEDLIDNLMIEETGLKEKLGEELLQIKKALGLKNLNLSWMLVGLIG